MTTCIQCGRTDEHALHCDSVTADGRCIVSWCRKPWNHNFGCDDMRAPNATSISASPTVEES